MKNILAALVFFIFTLTAVCQSADTARLSSTDIKSSICLTQDDIDTTDEDEFYPVALSPECSKYSNLSAGALICEAGRLNKAGVTVLLSCTAGGVTVACIPLMMGYRDRQSLTASCGFGCIIIGGGIIASACIFYVANNLLREAGFKLDKIQISQDGIIIKL